MRRLTLHRPGAKVRNPGRRLRRLRAWARTFSRFPERGEQPYRNWKIPVLDRLVEPPTTRHAWQSEALDCLLEAATNLLAARPEAMRDGSWVAVLVAYPFMWSSEVTVFFDREYYASFLTRPDAIPRRSLCAHLGLQVPEGMIESGAAAASDREARSRATVREEWWTIGEPLDR